MTTLLTLKDFIQKKTRQTHSFYPTNKGAVFGETTLAPNFDCTDEANILLGNMLTHHKILL